MKRTFIRYLIFLLAALSVQFIAFSQYWQQKVDYTIDVSLNEKDKTLDAFERMVYFNNSNDTLRFIWFHLWPNAYKNDRTAFSDQLLLNGNTSFYFSDKEERGYINRLDFKVNGVTAKTEDHPQHIDIIKLILPGPLTPGQQVIITTPFHVKLPFNFSRGGYDGNTFQITQWYPKPAVYDGKGWHEMPYLDQGEFYSEFGSFDVRITIPKNFVVAATGALQNDDEKQWWKTRTEANVTEKRKPKSIFAPPATGKKIMPSFYSEQTVTETKTLQFKQDSVHDFAWFANKNFIVSVDTFQINSGKLIDVFSFYTPEQKQMWLHSVAYAKAALRFYSNEVGPYPYSVATVVQGPQSFGGGMEYPTITIIAPTLDAKSLDETIAHELGHNWFYGMLASNERDHPWMDEGANTFYQYKYIEEKYGKQTEEAELFFQAKAKRKTDQAIETSSENFSEINYGAVAYHKTAQWLKSIETRLGKEKFRSLMQEYFSQWKFRHPYPENLQNIFQKNLGAETNNYFSRLNAKGILPGQELKGFQFVSPFKKGSISKWLKYPSKNTVFVSPSAGVNSYDGIMLGGLISNYQLPPNKLQFLLIPMYGTSSKKFTGLGKLNYTVASNGPIRKTDIFFNAADFSMDQFNDTAGRKLVMQFQKLVPGFRLTFREKDPKSTVNKFVQWKTFLFREQSLRISQDTLFTGIDTSLFFQYRLPKKDRFLNQLRFVYENSRALYPFDINLQVEQAKDFIRTTLTANYFFNYKEGGLQLRIFAGKFSYLNGYTINKQFNNERYFLNMTGPNGYEDYTYSDYFIGRNKFEETTSQQIMIRDGGFKVRTDLLASKIGKTDNWLAAINLNTSIPKNLNPLSVLPIKIPLHLFMDIGTYAEAWDRNSDNDHFLYDLGFSIPLFHESFNFYFPVLYNKVYGDYIKSTIPKNRFLKSMSFTINFYNRDIKKINRELEF